MRTNDSRQFLVLAAVAGLIGGGTLQAATFDVANTADAGSFGTITGQGFSAVSTSGDPGVANGTPVFLNDFRFFKGTEGAASASDLSLVVFNTAYPDLNTAASAVASVVGVSTNTIVGGTTFASGDALVFTFDGLALTYGSTYSVGLFSGVPGTATAVQISALTANYSESSPGTFTPTTNFGGADNFSAAAYFGVNANGFYGAYSGAGDSNFVAALTTEVPEPAVAGLGLIAAALLGRRRTGRSA